jgi:NAD-dependent SIR2 family protein deacetylase
MGQGPRPCADAAPGRAGLDVDVVADGLLERTRCMHCGNATLGTMVYRHGDQAKLCEECAERLGVEAKPSKRFMRARRAA